MAATQKPIALQCLSEPMTEPPWKEKPAWFLIAENDRMAFHGRENEVQICFLASGSYSLGFQARRGRRTDL